MPKSKAGRPKFKVTDEILAKVEKLASQGMAEYEIAAALGINWQTLAARKKDNAKFVEYLESGRAKGIAQVSNALFKNAMSGNVTAQKFYLGSRAGWVEKPAEKEPESGTGSKGQLIINLHKPEA